MGNGSEKSEPRKNKSKLKPHKSIKHKKKPRNLSLGARAEEKKGKEKVSAKKAGKTNAGSGSDVSLVSAGPADRQLRFFLHCFQTSTKSKLSPLELEAYNERCMVKLAEGVNQDVENLSDHIKEAFGVTWKEELCEGMELEDGEAGSPALLVISTSALRSLELLRGLKPFTKDCRPAKLFAKHLKVEEQVTLLKARVNIAAGTPSRIKKLIDMEALSLTRLKLVVLDMQRDAKAFSLFTLPQVSTEFWDLYKSHLEEKVTGGDSRICLYGTIPTKEVNKAFKE
ncbi:Protein CMSS1 [Rhynchospora pubera]|uniref:Protein CMSS1 n=1 Tax=Rhynchospora pubera TaxID=906938 RepID=A0AAV8D2U0_9POAL|nr:Protein CMSS1 [Rhynchospora pubera]